VDYNEGFKWSTLKSVFLEWKIWLAVVAYWGNSIPIYGFTYTAPQIILELGYTSAQAQLLTVPVYTLGVISTIGFSFWADKRRVRWPFVTGPFAIAAVGLIGLLSIPHPRFPGLTYFFLFFIPAGIYPALIGILSLVSNNLAGSWKRAVGMALLISIGNFGGAIGSNIFQSQGAPHYWLGYGFCFGIISAAIVCMFILRWAYSSQNKKRDAMTEEYIKEKYTDEELQALGDKSPHYRYVT
jgi:MFS family permease